MSHVNAGRLGQDVNELGRNGLPVATTVLVEADACRTFHLGTLAETFFDEAFASTQEVLPQGEVILRPAPPRSSIWGGDELRILPSRSNVRNALTHLYRSISSPRARASRIEFRMSDAEAASAVLIQTAPQSEYSVLSRHGASGLPTTEANWQHNVNNILPQNASGYIAAARRAEIILRRPVRLFFATEQGEIRVTAVDEAIMTDAARWATLDDLFRTGTINDLEFVRNVTPEMLGHVQGFELRRERPGMWQG
jgi:hypothetical protein